MKKEWIRCKNESSCKLRRLKILLLTFVLSGVGLLSGCNTIEVEDRSFPLVLAVDETKDLEAIWFNQEEEGTKMVDYNHLKVLILGEKLYTDQEELEKLLELMEEDERLPRNTYVVVTRDTDQIMALDQKIEDGLGTYLEELLEGNASMDSKAYPTLGMLYQDYFNEQETFFLPYIAEQDGTPFVEQYAVWQRGKAAGTVPTEMAMLSALLQGNLQKETICLDSGNAVRLDQFQIQMDMTEEDGKKVNLSVSCEGELLYQEKEEDLEIVLENYYQELLADALLQNVDISNSFKSLGGYQRNWYTYYQEHPDQFEQDISVELSLHITWLTS